VDYLACFVQHNGMLVIDNLHPARERARRITASRCWDEDRLFGSSSRPDPVRVELPAEGKTTPVRHESPLRGNAVHVATPERGPQAALDRKGVCGRDGERYAAKYSSMPIRSGSLAA
jgi:hypothetical protein